MKSRSFGVRLTNQSVLRDVQQLLAADANRHHYQPQCRSLVISPDNARRRLSTYIRQARRSLSIYDPNLSDDKMIALVKARARAGIDVRILGKLEKKWRDSDLLAEPCPLKRLDVRAIIRDGKSAFIGSQGLRRLELDQRREVGIIVRAATVVKTLTQIFEADWRAATDA